MLQKLLKILEKKLSNVMVIKTAGHSKKERLEITHWYQRYSASVYQSEGVPFYFTEASSIRFWDVYLGNIRFRLIDLVDRGNDLEYVADWVVKLVTTITPQKADFLKDETKELIESEESFLTEYKKFIDQLVDGIGEDELPEDKTAEEVNEMYKNRGRIHKVNGTLCLGTFSTVYYLRDYEMNPQLVRVVTLNIDVPFSLGEERVNKEAETKINTVLAIQLRQDEQTKQITKTCSLLKTRSDKGSIPQPTTREDLGEFHGIQDIVGNYTLQELNRFVDQANGFSEKTETVLDSIYNYFLPESE